MLMQDRNYMPSILSECGAYPKWAYIRFHPEPSTGLIAKLTPKNPEEHEMIKTPLNMSFL